jgi:hypothetical protein
MAIAMFSIFSIVIAIAICHVPLVVASVEVRATTAFRAAIIDVAVAAPNSGSVTVLETCGRAIAAVETSGATIATAFNAACRTIAASAAAPVAASAAVTATAASAAVTATATATQRAAAAGTTAATCAGTTAPAATAPASASAASAASAAFANEIDKVGVCVGRGLDVQHWRRIGDSSAQHQTTGESAHRFPIDTHHNLHLI